MNKPILVTEAKKLKYDLRKAFKKWNRKLFDNKLEKVKLRYAKTKTNLGKVRFKYRGKVGTPRFEVTRITDLSISSFFDLPEDLFHSTLIHEMIHLYMLQNYEDFEWDGGYHGREFEKMARDLSRKSGYDITKRYDSSIKRLKVTADGKPIVVAVIFLEDGRMGGWAMKPKVWEDDRNQVQLIQNLTSWYNDDWEIWKTTAAEVLQLTISRKLTKTLSFDLISPELFDDIKREGERVD